MSDEWYIPRPKGTAAGPGLGRGVHRAQPRKLGPDNAPRSGDSGRLTSVHRLRNAWRFHRRALKVLILYAKKHLCGTRSFGWSDQSTSHILFSFSFLAYICWCLPVFALKWVPYCWWQVLSPPQQEACILMLLTIFFTTYVFVCEGQREKERKKERERERSMDAKEGDKFPTILQQNLLTAPSISRNLQLPGSSQNPQLSLPNRTFRKLRWYTICPSRLQCKRSPRRS